MHKKEILLTGIITFLLSTAFFVVNAKNTVPAPGESTILETAWPPSSTPVIIGTSTPPVVDSDYLPIVIEQQHISTVTETGTPGPSPTPTIRPSSTPFIP